MVAMKNHMDLALNIAIGSSIQIALFVAPVLVFASHFMRHGPMDLRFPPFEVLAVMAAVGVVNLVAQDGESNWLEGALLMLGVRDPRDQLLRIPGAGVAGPAGGVSACRACRTVVRRAAPRRARRTARNPGRR